MRRQHWRNAAVVGVPLPAKQPKCGDPENVGKEEWRRRGEEEVEGRGGEERKGEGCQRSVGGDSQGIQRGRGTSEGRQRGVARGSVRKKKTWNVRTRRARLVDSLETSELHMYVFIVSVHAPHHADLPDESLSHKRLRL